MKNNKNSFLPKDQSDKPDSIIKKDKRLLSTLLILLILLIIINLIIGFAAAIDNAVQERGSVAQVFLVIFTAVINIVLVVVMVSVAHNVSRSTTAVLKIAEKLLGEEVIRTDNRESADEQGADVNSAKAMPVTYAVKPIQHNTNRKTMVAKAPVVINHDKLIKDGNSAVERSADKHGTDAAIKQENKPITTTQQLSDDNIKASATIAKQDSNAKYDINSKAESPAAKAMASAKIAQNKNK